MKNRSTELGASIGVENGTPRAFEFYHRTIVVDGHDEQVAFGLGTFEITYVTNVDKIEAAVGENDSLSRGTGFRCEATGRLEIDSPTQLSPFRRCLPRPPAHPERPSRSPSS